MNLINFTNREIPNILSTFSKSLDPDQRASVGALWYGSELFEDKKDLDSLQQATGLMDVHLYTFSALLPHFNSCLDEWVFSIMQ